jgi:hypothetical protein
LEYRTSLRVVTLLKQEQWEFTNTALACQRRQVLPHFLAGITDKHQCSNRLIHRPRLQGVFNESADLGRTCKTGNARHLIKQCARMSQPFRGAELCVASVVTQLHGK